MAESLQNRRPGERVLKGLKPLLGQGGVGGKHGLLGAAASSVSISSFPSMSQAAFHFISQPDADVI